MIMHFHFRAGFRRGAVLALRDKLTRSIPTEIRNIVNYLICKNSPSEMTETRCYDEEYQKLLRSLDARTKKVLAESNIETLIEGFERYESIVGSFDEEAAKCPQTYYHLHNILDNYKISRQQSDDWEEPLPIFSLIEKIQKDIWDGVCERLPEAQTIRTISGFEAYLNSLKLWILNAGPSFDFDYFVKIMILSEEQSVQVENERHWQHRWQRQMREKLLEYASKLVEAGLLSESEDILTKNKDEILNLAYCLENCQCRNELKTPLSDKAVNWVEEIGSIELHLTNKCNLSESPCCKGICTYDSLHGSSETFPFKYFDGIAKFKPKLIYLCGGGEPTLYADGSKTFADAIYRIRQLLPKTELILGTNGIELPDGNWQKELASIRICLHVFSEKDFDENKSELLKKAWKNIWAYYTGKIGEIWVTFKYDRKNYMECFSLIEKLWIQRDRLCKINPLLYKKELGVKIMAVADDGNPGDPFRLSNPTGEMRERWAKKCDSLIRADTPFGNYMKKIRDGFVDAGFILPKEFFTGVMPSHKAERVDRCWPVTGYVLAAADGGKLYSCPAMAAQRRDSLGTVNDGAKIILNNRKEFFHNPCELCRNGCRMLTTFMSAPIVGLIKKETAKTIVK